jgi:hypothetical protein
LVGQVLDAVYESAKIEFDAPVCVAKIIDVKSAIPEQLR